jgi:hypothetical protein
MEHSMNVRDLSALERTAAWLTEVIQACRRGGILYGKNPNLVRDVTRKAKALRTSLNSLRDFLIPNDPNQKEDSKRCEWT